MLSLEKEPLHDSLGLVASSSVEPDHGGHSAATEPKLPAEVKSATGAVFWPQLPVESVDASNPSPHGQIQVENTRGLAAEVRVEATGPPLRSAVFCSLRTLS